MNITEFFQLRAGTWKSQRTSHHMTIQKSESGNSEIQVDLLESLDPQVVELCNLYNFAPGQVMCAAKVAWGSTMAWDKDRQKQDGSTILVAIADGDDPQQGKLLHQQSSDANKPGVGRYVIGYDDVLRLITEHSEEKLWFPRPNICMRAGFTIGEVDVSSFCTEIRKSLSAATA